MRRALVLGAIAILLGGVQSAAGAPSDSLRIRLGIGIGPINLGMTGDQVRRALGPPDAVLERRVVRGQAYLELAWRAYSWNVGLLGPPGNRRVAVVGTSLRHHRTRGGVGVGTTETELARKLPAVRERQCLGQGYPVTHWYLRRGAAETVFRPYARATRFGPRPRREVGGVEVRSGAAVGCVIR